MPEMDDDKGTGLVLVNTNKGLSAIDWNKINHKETTAEVALRHNSAYNLSVYVHPNRRNLFSRLDKANSVIALIDEELRLTLKYKLIIEIYRFRRLINKLLNLHQGGVKYPSRKKS